MSGTFQQVILIGNLGSDPEIKAFNDGGRIALLSVATSRKWKARDTGEPVEKTEWHRVVIKGDGLVNIIESYCRRGSKLHVVGELETRKWSDQSGVDRYTTEIVVAGARGQVTLLGDGRGGGSGSSAGRGGSYDQSPYSGGGYDDAPF